ncbi:hypothetical protein HRbin15_01325 [bacterium HR15]|nr:hypothetical protein HRbin15_01325 [bacterium HR15]
MNEETVRNWIRKAENDLKIGKDEMSVGDPVTDMVCFHMQQCVEKYLKAFLIFHGKEYPKTHRIAVLVGLCSQIDPEFQTLMDWEVDRLSRYATTLRYGEEFYTPSLEETREAIELAEKTKAFVLTRLKEKGFAPNG